jgi:hypothetical protein
MPGAGSGQARNRDYSDSVMTDAFLIKDRIDRRFMRGRIQGLGILIGFQGLAP